MSKTSKSEAHTPGPWRTGKRRDGSSWLSIGNPERGPHFQGDAYFGTDANARLVEAAPEMFAALEMTLLAEDPDGCPQLPYGTYLTVKAAIAKARGEPLPAEYLEMVEDAKKRA